MTFTRLPHADKDDWLEQRKGFVTATEIGRLLTKGPAEWGRLHHEKEHGSDFHGNAVTRWGNARELEIGEYLTTFVDTRLESNTDLFVLEGTPVAATPDMVPRDLGEECEIIGEIKTSGRQLVPAECQDAAYHSKPVREMPEGFPRHYWMQVQTQLLVTGAEVCVFACEVREDDPDGGFYPGETRYMFIAPDKVLFDRVLETATVFMAGEFPEPAVPAELQGFVDDFLDAKQRMDDAKAAIEEIVGIEKNTFDLEGATVTVVPDGKTTRLNGKALAEDHPDIAAHYYQTSPRKGGVRIKERKEAA